MKDTQGSANATWALPELLLRRRENHELVYSVEHFYPQHPEHPLAPLMSIRQGFMREHGLDNLGLVISETDTNAVEQVAAGHVDIAMDSHPAVALRAAAAGQDIRIIAAYRNGMPFEVWARRGIASMADLKGKRLGIIKLTDVAHRAFTMVLPQFGIDPEKDVEFVAGSGETRQRIENLRTGAIDATVLQDELEVPWAEPFVGEINKIDDMARLLPHYVARATITSERVLRDRSDSVKGFLKSVMRAQQYLHDQDSYGQEAVEVVKAALDVSELSGSRMEQGWSIPWAIQAKDIKLNVEGILTQAGQYQRLGQLPAGFDAQQAIDVTLANQAFDELALA